MKVFNCLLSGAVCTGGALFPHIAAAGASAASPAPHAKTAPGKGAPRPNVVIFLADDLGWMDVSYNGSKFYDTPNIDALLRQGMVFNDAYAACPVSSPTRAAMMTGKYPARLHLTDWIPGFNFAWARMSVPQWTQHLETTEVTIAEVLRGAGYHTWHIGKWHLGNEPYYPEKQGFDINIGGGRDGSPTLNDKCNGYFSPYCKPNLPEGPAGEYLTDRLTDEAIKLIRGSGDGKPFFLNMCHYAVHLPLMAREDAIAKYKARVDENWFQQNATYAAMIESLDQSLGRIVAALKEKKVYDNTLFIFTSDNGALFSVSKSFPLRDGKGSCHEGGVRVPMVVVWPGRVKAGTASDCPVITCDIPATLMDMVASPQLSKVDGQSLLPVLAGGALPERPIFWHYPHYHNGGSKMFSAVRMGDWRLVQQLEDNSIELYNLREDIGETKNLAASNPAKAKELLALLEKWRRDVGAQMPSPNPDYDPAKANKKDNKVEE